MINEVRRDIQREALLVAEESGFNGALLLPTGSGKAWILIEILKILKPKTCWYLVDSEDNRDVSFKKELIKWGAGDWIDKIEFMCYQSAYKRKGEKAELLLADEADFSLTKQYSKVYFNNTFKHKILVSGSLAPDKRELLESIVPIIYSIHLKQAEDKKALNKTKYFFVNYMLTKDENKKYLGYNKRFSVLLNAPNPNQKSISDLKIARKHFLSNLSSSRNVCRRLMKDLNIKGNKTLIFCGLSSQADAVCKYTYHSKSDDNKWFNLFDKGEINFLAVVAKIDRGVNINGVNVIIFESPSNSSTKFLQRSGRGRRLDVSDILNVYFLVPYYKTLKNKTMPTVVLDWIYRSTQELTLKPTNYKFND